MAFSQASSLSVTPNVTPLIDVLLVLLIIFMVIVPTAPRGLRAAVPQPATSSASEEHTVLLAVLPAADGAGVRYELNGRPVEGTRLEPLLAGERARANDPNLFVSGDGQLDYGAVAAAVSKAHQAGFVQIGLLSGKPSASRF